MTFYDTSIVYNCILTQLNIYNLNTVVYKRKYKLDNYYNTYADITNRKVINLNNHFNLLTNQRCCLTNVRVIYYRKKIIKNLHFQVNLSNRNGINLLKYFRFYIYFFNIYYQNNLKYSFLPTSFKLHIDNPNLFFKSYSKQNQNIRFNFFLNKVMNKNDFIYLNNYFFTNFVNNK